jgi:hypothetical protein
MLVRLFVYCPLVYDFTPKPPRWAIDCFLFLAWALQYRPFLLSTWDQRSKSACIVNCPESTRNTAKRTPKIAVPVCNNPYTPRCPASCAPRAPTTRDLAPCFAIVVYWDRSFSHSHLPSTACTTPSSSPTLCARRRRQRQLTRDGWWRRATTRASHNVPLLGRSHTRAQCVDGPPPPHQCSSRALLPHTRLGATRPLALLFPHITTYAFH